MEREGKSRKDMGMAREWKEREGMGRDRKSVEKMKRGGKIWKQWKPEM